MPRFFFTKRILEFGKEVLWNSLKEFFCLTRVLKNGCCLTQQRFFGVLKQLWQLLVGDFLLATLKLDSPLQEGDAM
jgi:hypothetical protein